MKLTEKQQEIFEELFVRYPVLEKNRKDILKAYEVLETCYRTGGKLLVAGNGGSCADEALQHSLAMENISHGADLARSLQGSLRAIALDGHPGLSTAFANDVDADMIFAQQVCGYGDRDDVFLGISTSGNSKNVDYAVTVAKAKGLSVVGLTGKDGGLLGKRADVAVIVPETETFKIQELHLPIYHALCLMLEEAFFEE